MPTLPHRKIFFSTATAIATLLSACGGGGGGGSIQSANRAPVAVDDAMRADGAALDSIDVLGNDTDPDGDALTVSIEEAPPVGSASVNSNGTVRLELPASGFKGVTGFRYRVTDPRGAFSVAAAAIFVGAEPFRAVFVGDESGDGSNELYLTDFAAAARQLTASDDGRTVRGFAASDNGATVAFRREDGTGAADLSFVRTADADAEAPIGFPGDAQPLRDAQGNEQFAVSPDGQWIAAVAGSGSDRTLYVLNVADPDTVMSASPTGAPYVALPRFSFNSQSLFFLASPFSNAANQLLYTIALSDPATPALVSAPLTAGSSDTVLEYSVASDQSRILLQARREGRVGLYFVDPSQLQVETRVNHLLLPSETIVASTLGLALGSGGSAGGERVAYTTQLLSTFRSYVAEAAVNPNPRQIALAGAHVIGFRPDGAALLYSRNGEIYETVIDSAAADPLIGQGDRGWYDSTGNIVLLEQSLPSGGSPPHYPAAAVAVRETFGATQTLGTPGLAAHLIAANGIDRGVAIIGQGATTGAPPPRLRLALVNALAPEQLLYLAEFESPTELSSEVVRVVGY